MRQLLLHMRRHVDSGIHRKRWCDLEELEKYDKSSPTLQDAVGAVKGVDIKVSETSGSRYSVIGQRLNCELDGVKIKKSKGGRSSRYIKMMSIKRVQTTNPVRLLERCEAGVFSRW
jgi:hypothetical protein